MSNKGSGNKRRQQLEQVLWQETIQARQRTWEHEQAQREERAWKQEQERARQEQRAYEREREREFRQELKRERRYAQRHARARERYPEYRGYAYRSRFSWWKCFLFVAGVIVIGAALLALRALILAFIAAIRPYLSIVQWIVLGTLAFLLLTGVAWVLLKLYGLLQEQLSKKERRDYVRVPKGEQLAVRESRRTRPLRLLSEEEAPRTAQLVASSQAEAAIEQPPARPSEESATPPVVHYASVRGSICPGHVLLGIREDRTLRLGEWDDINTLVVLGGMGTGKSNTIAEKTAEAAEGGALLVVCDSHAHKPDSLYRRVAPLAHCLYPGTGFAVSHEDTYRNLLLVRDELERRVSGGTYSRPLVLVIDEVNRLLRDEELKNELLTIAEILGQEGRGFLVYGIFGLQRITYATEFRKIGGSVIVHRIAQDEAKLVIPQRYAKWAPELPNGMTFVRDADGVTERLQQVLITDRDIELIASGFSASASLRTTRNLPPRRTRQFTRATRDLHSNKQAFPQSFQNVSKQGERPVEQRLVRLLDVPSNSPQTPKNPPPTKVNVSEEVRREIIRLALSGMSRRHIKDRLGLHGAKYEIIRRVLDEEGL